MKIIWTRNSLPLSKLIRWGLKEQSSHVAIVFDNKIVFHSNLMGVGIQWYNTFKKQHEVVYEIDYKMSLVDEETIYQSIINQFDGYRYDYRAFVYFVWRGVLKRFLNKPLPKINPFDNENSFMCIELLKVLPKIENLNKLPENLSMLSPDMTYSILTDQHHTQQQK